MSAPTSARPLGQQQGRPEPCDQRVLAPSPLADELVGRPEVLRVMARHPFMAGHPERPRQVEWLAAIDLDSRAMGTQIASVRVPGQAVDKRHLNRVVRRERQDRSRCLTTGGQRRTHHRVARLQWSPGIGPGTRPGAPPACLRPAVRSPTPRERGRPETDRHVAVKCRRRGGPRHRTGTDSPMSRPDTSCNAWAWPASHEARPRSSPSTSSTAASASFASASAAPRSSATGCRPTLGSAGGSTSQWSIREGSCRARSCTSWM